MRARRAWCRQQIGTGGNGGGQAEGSRRHLQAVGREVAGRGGQAALPAMAQAVGDHQNLAGAGRRGEEHPHGGQIGEIGFPGHELPICQ